ncbi:protein of unknown function [Burkholderia multivorans]
MNQGSEDAKAPSDHPSEAVAARRQPSGGAARALCAIVLMAPSAARARRSGAALQRLLRPHAKQSRAW